MRRTRQAKIVGTLGPSSSSEAVIQQLFESGVDVFRLNFSHGSHQQHAKTHAIIRQLEKEQNRPIGIMADLQGPKYRVGEFENVKSTLKTGQIFTLDLDPQAGSSQRVCLPHPELFDVLSSGCSLLIDDGKIELEVVRVNASSISATVVNGGVISSNKGVNLPDVVVPVSPITEKDHADLQFALSLGVDWVALSFVQKVEDVEQLRVLIEGKASIIAKLEKPSALDDLDNIVQACDAIMVARGDLGVEVAQERVPVLQRRIIRSCRRFGKPVVVATQMLESMTSSPVPTRAESSDVASAIYDGADAVMLSAETAAGKYPNKAVMAMNRIICEVEKDETYRISIKATMPETGSNVSDAISSSLSNVSNLVPLVATVTYTQTGFTSISAARERPEAPIISCTPSINTARTLALVWGVHAFVSVDMANTDEMVTHALSISRSEGFASSGDLVAITAGAPIGRSGTTNMLRIDRVAETPTIT